MTAEHSDRPKKLTFLFISPTRKKGKKGKEKEEEKERKEY